MQRGSYLLLEPGMRVRDVNGRDVGTIADVVADEAADIFRGIVVARHGFSGSVFVPADGLLAVDGNVASLSLTAEQVSGLGHGDEPAAGESDAAPSNGTLLNR